MALIKCNECSGDLSTEATACPHCGAPTTKALVEKADAAAKRVQMNQQLRPWEEAGMWIGFVVGGGVLGLPCAILGAILFGYNTWFATLFGLIGMVAGMQIGAKLGEKIGAWLGR